MLENLSKILLFGANGQLGSQIHNVLGNKIIPLTRKEVDLSSSNDLQEYLNKINDVDAIINASAYTLVDKAESENRIADSINNTSVEVMAKYCKEKSIPLVHYSTDYVFDGSLSEPYTENEKTSPINYYGKSKLSGENAIIRSGCKFLIFRTSWVYDHHNKNFITTMFRLAKEKESLSIVSDQIGSPTYVPHLAEQSLKGFDKAIVNGNFGIYHLCGSQVTSWFDFAKTFFENLKLSKYDLKIKNVLPILTKDYPTPAKRPLNSRMNCNLAYNKLNIRMPSWQDGLKECTSLIIKDI